MRLRLRYSMVFPIGGYGGFYLSCKGELPRFGGLGDFLGHVCGKKKKQNKKKVASILNRLLRLTVNRCYSQKEVFNSASTVIHFG